MIRAGPPPGVHTSATLLQTQLLHLSWRNHHRAPEGPFWQHHHEIKLKINKHIWSCDTSQGSLDFCQSWICSVRLHGAAVALLGNHQPHQFPVEFLDLLHVLSLVRLVLQTLEESRGETESDLKPSSGGWLPHFHANSKQVWTVFQALTMRSYRSSLVCVHSAAESKEPPPGASRVLPSAGDPHVLLEQSVKGAGQKDSGQPSEQDMCLASVCRNL